MDMKKILKISGLVLCLMILGPITAGLVLGGLAKDVAAPGRLVDVGGYKLHINCSGPENGLPPVIIEAGVGMPSPMYHWYQESLSEKVKVCTYDRAGLGWSEESGLERDSTTAAKALHTLLHKEGISRPVVLAGHSLGGLHVRVYNNMYPDDVKAIALLDASHPRQNEVMDFGDQNPEESLGTVSSVFNIIMKLGLTRLYNLFTVDVSDEYPDEIMQELNYIFNQSGPVQSLFKEMKASDTVMAQTASTGNLGDKPVMVISASAPYPEHFMTEGIDKEKLRRDWTILQKEIAGLSTNSRQVIMDKAHHMSLVFNKVHAEEAAGHILELVME